MLQPILVNLHAQSVCVNNFEFEQIISKFYSTVQARIDCEGAFKAYDFVEVLGKKGGVTMDVQCMYFLKMCDYLLSFAPDLVADVTGKEIWLFDGDYFVQNSFACLNKPRVQQADKDSDSK